MTASRESSYFSSNYDDQPRHDGDFLSQKTATELPLVAANDQYTNIKILKEHEPRKYEADWGEGVLRVLDVRLTREYENGRKRTTEYPVSIGTRRDIGDRALYLVSHSDALLTTMRVDGTATSHFFWNPVRAGFPTVNVGVKRHTNPIRRLLPHTIPLHEMGDDSLAATMFVANDKGLGLEAGEDGLTPLGATGYSRGFQLALLKAARARLHKAKVVRIQGKAPGPRNKASLPEMASRLIVAAPHEGLAILKQLVTEPGHAVHNYRNVITHDGHELISYVGDAAALMRNDVADAMYHIDRSIKGRGLFMKRDPFGPPSEFADDFKNDPDSNTTPLRPFTEFQFDEVDGAHLSAMDSKYVSLDNHDWQDAAREFGVDMSVLRRTS